MRNIAWMISRQMDRKVLNNMHHKVARQIDKNQHMHPMKVSRQRKWCMDKDSYIKMNWQDILAE